MVKPTLVEEKKLWRQGYQWVAGLDEAGRGPLAGPVVAAAVALRQIPNSKLQIPKVNDSKKLSEKKREELYELLTTHPDIQWGVGLVSETVIDRINILQATKLAMQKAIKNLDADFLLLDGNFLLDKVSVSQKAIVKGDQKVFSIAAASIIAKVTRDRLMQKLHQRFPQYGFDLHKGYGTALHMSRLKRFGACKAHRKSFCPAGVFPKERGALVKTAKI